MTRPAPKRILPKKRIGLWGRMVSLWLLHVLWPHTIAVLRQTWTLGGWQLYVNVGFLAVLIGAMFSELWIFWTGLE